MTPQRIQLSRANVWRMPKNTVKVGRTTPYSSPGEILAMVRQAGLQPYALAINKDGTPAHPLMLPDTCYPVPFS